MTFSLYRFIEKIIQPHEIATITELSDEIQSSVSIGEFTSFDSQAVTRLMSLWCNRIDKLIEIDKEVNEGVPSWKSHFAIKWRGFTYTEYYALFNIHIPPDDYSFYPVFNQLNKDKGGVVTEKQRADLQSNLTYNEESYIEALRQAGIEQLLKTFFSQLAKLSALLPLRKLKMHTYLCASTGSGKSELMRVLFHRMVRKYPKFSFILIDPHGSLAESVKRLKSVSSDADRVVYIEPFLKEGFTPTFNPFFIKDTSVKNITFTAEQIISAIEETLSREGGRLTEVQVNMLEKCVYFLLYRERSTILDLVKLLRAEENIFAQAQQHEPTFFNEEFTKPSNRTRKALLDRVDRLLNSPILRNLLGGESTFDLEYIINSGKILIVNLGDAGEMTQIAFGKFLVASIKSIIRKRKKNHGLPTFLFVDEVQSMISGSFDYMLSQLRGFGLHLVMANQYLNQLGDQAETVKQNTAIKIVASDDYEDMKKVLKTPKDVYLKDYEFFLKVRGYPIHVFKSPDVIIKNKSKYEITKEQENTLDDLQIERYYRAYNQEEFTLRKSTPTTPNDEPQETKFSSNSPRPPFDLHINE